MGGFSSIVRSGVAIANRLTAGLQVQVSHEAWIRDDGKGKPVYATAISRPAIVQPKSRLRRAPNGREVMQRAAIVFVGPVEANGAAGRQEPIDPRDKLTLPDGTTGPILGVDGLTDPKTNAPYMYEVALG